MYSYIRKKKTIKLQYCFSNVNKQVHVPSSEKLFWSLSSELFLMQEQQTFDAENSQDFLVYQVKKTKTNKPSTLKTIKTFSYIK